MTRQERIQSLREEASRLRKKASEMLMEAATALVEGPIDSTQVASMVLDALLLIGESRGSDNTAYDVEQEKG